MKHVNDFGPIYAETNPLNFPVEPWNAASNIVFLLIIIYWFPKIRGRYNKHRLFTVGLPILLTGFVGGTVYHATRSHSIWLFMDFIPIFVLLTLTDFHIWYLISRNVILSFFLMSATLSVNFLIRKAVGLPWVWKITASYSTTAFLILLPAFILSYRYGWKSVKELFFIIMFFASAVFFRQIDRLADPAVLPMGTHFLWHICGGGAVYFLMSFVYSIENSEGHGVKTPVHSALHQVKP